MTNLPDTYATPFTLGICPNSVTLLSSFIYKKILTLQSSQYDIIVIIHVYGL